VSLLAIRRVSLRFRRRGATLVAVMAIGGLIAVHHSGAAMGDMHADAGMGTAMELCLGVLIAVGTAAAAVAIGVIGLGRWRPPVDLHVGGLSRAVAQPEARARPGPAVLSLLCVCRR
jgi:hypothetical protein